MKILVLCESPLTERDFKRFSLDELAVQGWEIVVIDMTSLVSVDPRSNCTEFLGTAGIKLIRTKSVPCFYSVLREFRPDFVIDLTCDRIDRRGVFQKLFILHIIRSHSRRVVFSLGSLPVAEPDKKKWLMKWYYSVVARLSRASNKDILFTGGTAGTEGISAKILHGYSFDINEALHEETKDKGTRKTKEEYILYIDQNSPYSSDRKHLGLANTYSSESYYNEVNRMLYLAEEKFNISVKVQGHPRASKSLLRKHYGVRILSDISTSAAIRESKMVIGHNSTALQIAVFYMKPILFTTLQEIEKHDCESRKRASIRFFANLLGCKVNYFSVFSDKWPDTDASDIDERKYTEYTEKYSTVLKGEKISNGKILSDYLGFELKKCYDSSS